MHIGAGGHTYRWVDNWVRLPDTELGRMDKAHHGVVVTEAGEIMIFHEGEPSVMAFDTDGHLQRSWKSDLTNAHGMTLVKEDGSEYLWLADNKSGQVVKTTMDGETVLRLARPDIAVYTSGSYKPTWVAVNEERNGGNGDVWVADGYGESHVHRYDKTGRYLSSINGEEGGAGAFSTPHGVFVDTRKSEPELYIADRRNRRVQVYDLDGKFKRAFGAEHLTSPSGFIRYGDLMAVVELSASIKLLDADDGLISTLGGNDEAVEIEGWPDVPSEFIESGKFNSPHGVAADSEGNLYVVEFITGGRITRLVK